MISNLPNDPFEFLNWCVDNSFEFDGEKSMNKLDLYIESRKNVIKKKVSPESITHELMVSVYKDIVEYYVWKRAQKLILILAVTSFILIYLK